MAVTHPYSSSGPGGIIQAVTQLRRQFPPIVNVATLKKLGISRGSESKIVTILKFVGVIDDEFKKTAKAGPIFAQHDDAQFQAGFANLVKEGYSDLFSLHGEGAWALSTAQLISFFRSSDQSSALMGQRQSIAFQALASLCGKMEAPVARTAPSLKKQRSTSETAKPIAKQGAKSAPLVTLVETRHSGSTRDVVEPAGKNRGLPSIHIDVQVHISPDTSPEQIDRIFSSMAKHLAPFI
jgi:hypothetical protein